MVAVTVQVSVADPAVTVVPDKVHVPAVIAKLTAPVPLPPLVLSVDVVIVAFSALGDAETVSDD